MTTAEIPAGQQFGRPEDRGGLGALGYKIFLDRYALKDMTKKSIAPGDTVVVVVDQKTGQREIGTVTARNDATVVVELREGGSVQQSIDHVDKPLETHPAQMVARVARGIAETEPTREKQAEWRGNFEWLLSDWRFIPGGRILAAAGTEQHLTFYNCFQGDTPVHTREGIVPIGSLEGEHEVLSEGGVYRKAVFRSYGHQRLWNVTLSNGAVIQATGDHQWVVTKPKGGAERVPTRALKGRRIPINPRPAPPRNEEFDEGVRHGIVFGDGSQQYGWAHVCLFGESEVLAERFTGYSTRHAGGTVATKAHVRVQRLPAAWKKLPADDASPSYWRGFVAGLISADGHVDERGSVMLHNKDPEMLVRIAEGMAIAGFVASSIALTRETSPFDGSPKPLYKLQLFKSTVTPDDLLLPSHRQNFEQSPTARLGTIQVIDVQETDRVEEVFCCVEPETHTITVGHGYLTGQCFVVPSPKDSRRGIIETLSNMMEIMSRGGGVGINVSSLRPKHAYVKGVNGRSSGAVSWGGLYSFVTGLIEQGGSRRGALMLILNDWHPDLLEFINAKREAGKITNANISVGVSDAFMKAVEQDADWQLLFPDTSDPDYDESWDGDLAAWQARGKPVVVHKTVKAREIWNTIIESAWASAEPGVYFRERANQMSNSWYYPEGQLVCTNPCGEQPLPAWGICNLGAIHLAKFVTPEREVLWEDLGRAVRYGIRFLDNVIDATPYFFEENEHQQTAERRVGLGTMGLGEMLIRLGIRYGSPESERFIDQLYEFIAAEAYLASAAYAAEKGAFPRFEAEKLLQSGYMQAMPERVRQAVREQGLRNVTLLTQAPTGCVAPSTIISTDAGLTAIADLGDRDGETWQSINLSVATDTGTQQASHFYVNGVRPVKTVSTRHGFRLTATGNHRLRVLAADGSYVWRRMDELTPGDEVVLKRDTVQGEPVVLAPTPRTKPALPPYPERMTPDLALLLGLYMGDGYTKVRGGLHLVLAGQDGDLIQSVTAVVERSFGARTVTVEQRQGCVVLNYADRALRRFFAANGFEKESGNHGEGAASAFIPDAVLRSGRACIAAFLRGLFEADGCVTRSTITLVSASPRLIEQVQAALLALGIVSAVRRMPPTADHRGTRPLYELRPLNRTEAVRFAAQIGFLSERKSALASAITIPTDGHRGDAIRNDALLREFYMATVGQPNALRQELLQRITNGSVTQAYLRSVLERVPSLRETRLARLLDMDVFLDSVADVADSVCDTYDLSVPQGNTYIANGFVSHNTTGTMMDTSTGIEPYFSWSYYRKGRLGLHEVTVPVVADWKAAHPDEELPEEFVTAMDLSPEEHIRVEAAIQRWIDSSISKTANLPADYTVEQTRELYELMYHLGCKGGTVYRDNSRDEQVLMLKREEPTAADAQMTLNGVVDAVLSPQSSELPAEPEGRPKPVRVPLPDERRSVTHKFQVGEQEGYITVGVYDDGVPGEVFLRVSKQGSTVSGLMESLGLLTSVALQYGVPLEGLARKMKNSRFEPYGLTGNREIPTTTSLVDYVFRWLEKKFVLGEQLPLLPVGNGAASGHEQLSIALEATGTETSVVEKEEVEHIPSGMGCPECGSLLHYAEGCLICRSCGYTKCG